MAPFLFTLVAIGTDHRRMSEPEPEEQHERGGRQRYEKLGSHVDRSSEVPVDADEDLVPPGAQGTLFDKAPKIHAVPDEERDVLPGIELRLHGKHRPVALLVLEAARPELVETTRYHDLLLHEVVGLNAETGRGAVEVAAQLARQAVELIPDQRAVDVETLPPHISRDTVTQAVETLAAGMVAILGIWRADDTEAPIDERRDVEGQLASIQEIEARHTVGVESLVLAQETDLAQEDVVDHGVEVGARAPGGVVHHLVRDELRLTLVTVLEQPEELRRERVRHDGKTLDRPMLDLELRRSDELAVRRVREVRVGIDLAGHEHRSVHRKPTVRADHRLAAHLHGRCSEDAEQAAEVQHEERFLAETHPALREVPALLEHDGVRRAFDLDEEAQVGQERPRYEERHLVWRGTLWLRRTRRLRVLEQPAFDPEGEAVDQRLDRPILFQAPDQASGAGGARDLEAHHVKLLAEPVQSRWPSVADVALQVVLAGEGGDRRRRGDIEHCERGGGQRQNERTPEHALPPPANQILRPREPGRPTRGWRERLNQEAGVTQKERW